MSMRSPSTFSASVRESIFANEVYRKPAAAEPDPLEAMQLELKSEVRALRALISKPEASGLAAELMEIRAALDEIGAGSAKRDKVSAWLRARGVDGRVATRIVTAANEAEGEIDARIRTAVASVATFAPWTFGSTRRRLVTLIGMSGVGKTTTAAKLAARERMAGRSVALISCDGFRVGALDQLEQYAGLIGASFHVARTGPELAALLNELDEQSVFVDTSDRPPAAGSPSAMLAARRANETKYETVTLLCAVAATRAKDAARIVRTFAASQPTAVCITKIDETTAPSGLLHVPAAARKPLALFCDGPRVPEDVQPASLESLYERLSGTQSGAVT
jgi:flagellar biosynthesis protein FlhF